MNWFDRIKKYYDKGFYNNDDVKVFVVSGKISAEEYEVITGVKYEE